MCLEQKYSFLLVKHYF